MTEVGAADADARKAVVRRHLTEAISANRPELWDELLHPDYVVHHRESVSTGADRYLVAVSLWRDAFPDWSVEIEDLLCDGDKVVARYRETGTHLGPLGSHAPTGRRYAKNGIGIYRIEDGRIAELWCQEDEIGFRRQLGLL